MIKCKIARKKKGRIKVKAYGTTKDLMVETAALINELFQNIHQQNPEEATVYKNHLLGLLLDPNSPVWKEPDHG